MQSAALMPFVGLGYRHDNNKNKGASTMRFVAELPGPGRYEVRLAYSNQSNRAQRVPVSVHHRGGIETIVVNQRRKPAIQNCWVSLGVYEFDEHGSVVVSNEGADGFVIADAVQFLPVDSSTAAVQTDPGV
jgi:hypothetical protein